MSLALSNSLPRGRRGRPRSCETECPAHLDQFAITQNGQGIGDGFEFLQPMRYIDNGHALGCQPGDLFKQVVGLAWREHGGGLVQNQHPGVVLQIAGDLHHLLLANAQVGHQHVRVDGLNANFGELLRRQGVEAAAIDPVGLPSATVRHVHQQQVFCHCQRGNQTEFLHDHPHAKTLGVAS